MAKIYLNNKDFYEQIIISKEKDELTKEAQEMLILLATRTIKKLRYYNPIDREDCFQTGMMIVFSNWRNFDPTKGTNAFAYFTEVLKRGFARELNFQYKLKGDPDRKVKVMSLQSSNDGSGIYNL